MDGHCGVLWMAGLDWHQTAASKEECKEIAAAAAAAVVVAMVEGASPVNVAAGCVAFLVHQSVAAPPGCEEVAFLETMRVLVMEPFRGGKKGGATRDGGKGIAGGCDGR